MNCIQNLEKQVGQIFKVLKKTEDCQIKGECQLTDLAKGVEFITQKFDEYQKYRREKDAMIATLENELKSTSMKVGDLDKRKERQEQYLRRNCILIHGLKEEKNKSTDERVLKLFREELNEDVLLADVLQDVLQDTQNQKKKGKKSGSSRKPRPVIVKFMRYSIREKNFKSEKKPQG